MGHRATATAAMAIVLLVNGCAVLSNAEVPEEYRDNIRAAAKQCPGLTRGVLAAQLNQESGWDSTAVSSQGAEGLAQFVPGTWQAWGRDSDGDGQVSPFDPEDAIDAQARLMCFLIAEAQASGISGDPLRLALAGYNAGWSNVQRYQGIPPFPETESYVSRIMDRAPLYQKSLRVKKNRVGKTPQDQPE